MQKILVADDVEINREILCEILQEDYLIETATDGEQAIQKLLECEGRLSALLLDLQMPNMDGYAVMEWMKKNQWMEKIPVLITSGEDSTEIENYCFEMGVLDFIHKPFEGSIVKNRVKNLVEPVCQQERVAAEGGDSDKGSGGAGAHHPDPGGKTEGYKAFQPPDDAVPERDHGSGDKAQSSECRIFPGV